MPTKSPASWYAANCRGQRLRRSAGNLRRAEAPERQQFRFVRLHEQHALLALADPVALRMLAEVDAREIQLVVERMWGPARYRENAPWVKDRRAGQASGLAAS